MWERNTNFETCQQCLCATNQNRAAAPAIESIEDDMTMAPTATPQRPVVQIVQCQSAFPVSKSKDKNAKLQPPPPPPPPRQPEQGQRRRSSINSSSIHKMNVRPDPRQRPPHQPHQPHQPPPPQVLDFATVSKEVRNLSATAFVKQKKRAYEDEQYERLTRRKRENVKVPLPILRGRAKKQAARAVAAAQHAKEAGIEIELSSTTPPANKRQKRGQKHEGSRSREARIHGPAPSVGFVAKGVLRINPKKRF
jgi:hypothetical protein